MKIKKRLPRLVVRLSSFLVFSCLLWPILPGVRVQNLVTQASPFVATGSSLGTREFTAGSAVGFLFAFIALWWRRWFCLYACPAGFIQENCAKIGWKRTVWWRNVPEFGKVALVGTLAGALVGYPVLLWMDPLAIFSSAFSVRFDSISRLGSGFGVAFLIILALTSGGLWCARLCPLGGMQDFLNSIKIWISTVYHLRSRVLSSALPVMHKNRMARRVFLSGAAGMGLAFWARGIGAGRNIAPLRPPGAVAEDFFAGLCIRCGNCIRACPSGIIYPDTELAGFTGLLAPVIRYCKGYCLEACSACNQVCPSGSLRLLSLEQKAGYVIGRASVDPSLCLLALARKECDACVRACPFDAVRINWDEDRYIVYPIVDQARCNGCGACEFVCPSGKIKAMTISRV